VPKSELKEAPRVKEDHSNHAIPPVITIKDSMTRLINLEAMMNAEQGALA